MRQSPLVQMGLLLSVLCAGIAAGALLSSVPAKEGAARPGVFRGAPVLAVPPVAGGSSSPGPEQRELQGADLPPAVYAPVDGSGETTDRALVEPEMGPGLDSVADLSLLPGPPGEGGRTGVMNPRSGGDETAGGPSREARRDHIATLSRATAAGALLFGVSNGDEVVLFDVGVPGARALPENVAGRWAWVGSCLPIEVEISQLPGGARGSVRGVGSSRSGSRYGWAVPANGCRASGAGAEGPGGGVEGRDNVRAGVVRLKSLGPAACDFAGECRWFVGLDTLDRVVALLARSSSRDNWIRLGGAFDEPR